jgi:hypothetical protein
MDNEGLIFIPDISGYTKFINQTEIEHSRFIIQELLEVLISSNKLSLNISEIEGDAILFYRFGKPPAIKEMYQQVEAMFCNFHKQLKQYEKRRICPCQACQNAKDLTLKVITHHGEFSTYSVREFKKLIGKDVIKAHQLLKNDIPTHEYWLITEDLFHPQHCNEMFPEWIQWRKGSKQDEHHDIGFHYSFLTPLKEGLTEDVKNELAIKGDRIKMITRQKDFSVDIEKLFGVVVDLTQRIKWIEGIDAVENISTPMPQIGTVHHCIMGKSANVLITSDFKKDSQTIILEETDKRKIGTCQMLLEKKGENNTTMTFNFFLKKNPLFIIFFKLFVKNKVSSALSKSLVNLDLYLKSLSTAA